MPNTEHKEHSFLSVAVGILESADEKILLARRPLNKHQGGLWEFPGGKIENFEDSVSALKREFMEELGVAIRIARPFMQIKHDYGEIRVLLDVFRVLKWDGVAGGMEGQEVRWVEKKSLSDYPFPEANLPIIKAVVMPNEYCITPERIHDSVTFLKRLEKIVSTYHCWVQFRSFYCKDISLEKVFLKTNQLLEKYQLPLLLNSSLRNKLPASQSLHLNSNDLMNQTVMGRPSWQIVGASCHNSNELLKAEALGLDYIFLGPVKKTLSHPGQATLGWYRFQHCLDGIKLPAYAIGGLSHEDLYDARRHGAQGIAMISAYWSDET